MPADPAQKDSMSKPSFAERFRYWFDNVMARGAVALTGLLALATLVFIVIVALVVVVFQINPEGVDKPSFPELIWGNLMRAMDAGTVAGDVGWGFRAVMLIVTLFGILTVASLIGIVSGAFDEKVAELRKGRSRVLENDHTLILGWNSKVFPIVAELVVANESRKRATIVVLAPNDKVEMEDELRAKIPKPGKTRIIVRSGDPMDLTDLALSNPHTARSVVILAPEGSEDPDSVVIKTALALTNNPKRKAGKYHIVGEIRDAANLEAANLVGKDEADWVLAADLISRITVQTCRQSGLSVVYTELLDFDGDEIYFTTEPNLHGKSYFDAQLSFAESTVIGMVKAGVVHINPVSTTTYDEGDQLIVVAEDDSTIRFTTAGVPDEAAISSLTAPAREPEQTLILGCNHGLTSILTELNEYVAPGSSVTLVADVEEPELATFSNMTVTFIQGDTTSHAVLAAIPVQEFEHIIVLAYKESMDAQRADARTLITLLHLRDMANVSNVNLNVVSEMLDDRNRELAEVTQADDFIVSDKLISLMMSQMSENAQLNEVFDTLFSSDGSEIYLRPAEYYVTPGSTVDFYTVLEAARRRGETAIGFRTAAKAFSSADDYGVRVNPKKSDLQTFAPGDRIVVLAAE